MSFVLVVWLTGLCAGGPPRLQLLLASPLPPRCDESVAFVREPKRPAAWCQVGPAHRPRGLMSAHSQNSTFPRSAGASSSRWLVLAPAPNCQSLFSLVIDFHQAPIWFWGARTQLLEQRQLPWPVHLCSGSGLGFLQRSLPPSRSCARVFVPVPSLLKFSLPPPQLSPVCFLAERLARGRANPTKPIFPLVSKWRPADRRHCLFPSDEQL